MHMGKIYFVNIITGFLNVLNQLKEPLIQNFIFFELKENVIARDLGSEIYILPFEHGNICGIEISQCFTW